MPRFLRPRHLLAPVKSVLPHPRHSPVRAPPNGPAPPWPSAFPARGGARPGLPPPPPGSGLRPGAAGPGAVEVAAEPLRGSPGASHANPPRPPGLPDSRVRLCPGPLGSRYREEAAAPVPPEGTQRVGGRTDGRTRWPAGTRRFRFQPRRGRQRALPDGSGPAGRLSRVAGGGGGRGPDAAEPRGQERGAEPGPVPRPAVPPRSYLS